MASYSHDPLSHTNSAHTPPPSYEQASLSPRPQHLLPSGPVPMGYYQAPYTQQPMYQPTILQSKLFFFFFLIYEIYFYTLKKKTHSTYYVFFF